MAAETKKLSKVMQECLTKIKEHGILVRWSGGYWTRPGCPVKSLYHGEVKIPEWFFTGSTIQSLIDRKIIVATEDRYDSYSGKYINTAVRLLENNLPS